MPVTHRPCGQLERPRGTGARRKEGGGEGGRRRWEDLAPGRDAHRTGYVCSDGSAKKRRSEHLGLLYQANSFAARVNPSGLIDPARSRSDCVHVVGAWAGWVPFSVCDIFFGARANTDFFRARLVQ